MTDQPEPSASTCPASDFHFEQPDRTALEGFSKIDALQAKHAFARLSHLQGCRVIAFTRRQALLDILQTPSIFSSNGLPLPETAGTSDFRSLEMRPETLDPPEHTKWRKLLSRTFAPASIERLHPTIRSHSIALIDALVADGRCDLVADFAKPFATLVFLDLVGIPRHDLMLFLEWEDAALHGDALRDPDHLRQLSAHHRIRNYFADLIAERRQDRGKYGDLISSALEWQVDGRRVTDEELVSVFYPLFLAGLDTVAGALSYGFYHLAQHSEDRLRLVREPDLIPAATDELLRAYPNVQPSRWVVSDTDFHSCQLRSGDLVWIPVAAAGRDPDVYPDATEVDFDRVGPGHLTFGAGPHRCLGAHLARAELIIAYREWHARIPTYSLAEDRAPLLEHSKSIWGLHHLPLVWPRGGPSG